MRCKVTINQRGVITIPVRMRRSFGIRSEDELIIEQTEEGLLIRPAFTLPIEVYSEERIDEFESESKKIGKLLSSKKSE